MPGPVSDKNIAEQISKLYELHQSGALTEAEFANAKRRLLGEAPPRMAAQPPSVVAWQDSEKPERSAFYHMARGFMIVVVGFVALIVVGVIAAAIFGGDSNETNGAENTRRQAAAPTATTQPAQSDPGPLLTGIVVMMNVANTDAAGSACYGVGDHAMLTEGAEVSVTAIGGHQDRTAWLSDGTVDQYGHCRMAFGIEWFDVDEYQFGFDNGLFVHCNRDAIVEIGDNYTTQVRIAPNGAYCQAPAN